MEKIRIIIIIVFYLSSLLILYKKTLKSLKPSPLNSKNKEQVSSHKTLFCFLNILNVYTSPTPTETFIKLDKINDIDHHFVYIMITTNFTL